MKTYDTIQIMREGFQPPELDQIVDGLKAEGHPCAVFKDFSGIGAALSNSRSGLAIRGSSPRSNNYKGA